MIQHTRSMTLLNEMGDLTITWDEDKDAEMAEIIQRKLDQGIRFFVVQPFNKTQVEVKKLEDITGRSITVPDEDIEKLFTDGKVGLIKRVVGTVIDTIRPATKVKDIVSNHTVGVRHMTGG